MADFIDWNNLPGQSYISADSTHIANCLVGVQATIDRDNMRKPIPQTFNYIKGGKGDKDITADESLQAGIMELLDGADAIASDTASAPKGLEAKSLELLNGFASTAKNANVDQHSVHEEPTKYMFENYIRTEPARAGMPISPDNPIRIFGKPVKSGEDAHRLVRGIEQSMEPRNLSVTLDQADHSLTFYPEPDACVRDAARRLCKDPEAYDNCLAVYRDVSAQEIRNADDAELAGTRKKDAVDADIYYRTRDMKDSFGASPRDLELRGDNVHGAAVPFVKALNKGEHDSINGNGDACETTSSGSGSQPGRSENEIPDDVIMSRFLGLLVKDTEDYEVLGMDEGGEITEAIREFFETAKRADQMEGMSRCAVLVRPDRIGEFEDALAVTPETGTPESISLEACKKLAGTLSSLKVNKDVGDVSDYRSTETAFVPGKKLTLFGRPIELNDGGTDAYDLVKGLIREAEPKALQKNIEEMQKLDRYGRVDRTLFRDNIPEHDQEEEDRLKNAALQVEEFTSL